MHLLSPFSLNLPLYEHKKRPSYAIILTRSSLGLMHVIFRTLLPELWPFIYAKILFPFNILRTNGQNFTKFYICIHIAKIYIGIVTHHLLHICTRAMALDLRKNIFSAHYLENKLIKFHQILYMHSYWQYLGWDWCMSFFEHLYQSYGPLFTPKFCFRSISWEQMDRISPNFIYAFKLPRSTLGLLHIIFPTFVPELWPLIYAKISFPLIILRTNW